MWLKVTRCRHVYSSSVGVNYLVLFLILQCYALYMFFYLPSSYIISYNFKTSLALSFNII